MDLPAPMVEGTLVRREKRFLAHVRLDDGREVIAHCPNPGRMTSCGSPGDRVWLSPARNPRRKLAWTWEVALPGGVAVLVNTQHANRLVREAVEAGRIPELAGYASVRAEVRAGGSRFDLLLEDPARPPCWVEVKSVTLRLAPGVGAFPDAVTARGRRHVEELAERARAGDRAVLFWCVGRGDVEVVRPADEVDPAWGAALRAAVADGVEVLAWRARVDRERAVLDRPLPVRLDPPASGP